MFLGSCLFYFGVAGHSKPPFATFLSPTVKTPEWSRRIKHFTIASTGLMVSRVVSGNTLAFHKLNDPFNISRHFPFLWRCHFWNTFSPQLHRGNTGKQLSCTTPKNGVFPKVQFLRGGPSGMICDITNTLKAYLAWRWLGRTPFPSSQTPLVIH